MSPSINNLAKDFADAIVESQNKRAKAYDTVATVLRIEGSTAWVHIPGGVDETPVKRTINAVRGDEVVVRISDGKAWIVGNSTNPPTDDTRANRALTVSVEASEIANIAAHDAEEAFRFAGIAEQQAQAATESAGLAAQKAQDAKESADLADEHALVADQKAQAATESAGLAAQKAQAAETYAEQAMGDAASANKYANSALDQLGIVQDVVGVLNWASEHGSFIQTQDTQIVDHKVYFVYDSVSGDYMPVVDPQESELANYYELSVDEAMDSYILSHLAVTSRGLWILPAGIGSAQGEHYENSPGYKMLLASGQNPGMYLYDQNGTLVTSYGADAVEFADNRQFHIGNQNAYILFTPASGSTAASITIGGANITLGDQRSLDDVLASMDSTISNTLIYNHTYSIANGVATFVPHVYVKGQEVTTTYASSCFAWSYRLIDGSSVSIPVKQTRAANVGTAEDRGCMVTINQHGYGGHVIGTFTPPA